MLQISDEPRTAKKDIQDAVTNDGDGREDGPEEQSNQSSSSLRHRSYAISPRVRTKDVWVQDEVHRHEAAARPPQVDQRQAQVPANVIRTSACSATSNS